MSPGSQAAEENISSHLEKPLTALRQCEEGPTWTELLWIDNGSLKLLCLLIGEAKPKGRGARGLALFLGGSGVPQQRSQPYPRLANMICQIHVHLGPAPMAPLLRSGIF